MQIRILLIITPRIEKTSLRYTYAGTIRFTVQIKAASYCRNGSPHIDWNKIDFFIPQGELY